MMTKQIMQTMMVERGRQIQQLTGNHIKLLRKALGLPCIEFAKQIGYTRPYVSAVENGLSPMTLKFVRALERVFGDGCLEIGIPMLDAQRLDKAIASHGFGPDAGIGKVAGAFDSDG